MKGRVSLMLGMALIGSFVVVNKRIVAEVPIFIASELRLGLGALCLLALAWRRRSSIGRLHAADWPTLLFQVLIGVVLFSIFMLNGLRHTSAMNAGIIMGMTPVAILFLAFLGRKGHLDGRSIVSAALACAGAIALNTAAADDANAPRAWLGNLLVFLAMLGEAVFISAGRFTRRPLHPLLLSTAMACSGALMFLPLAATQWHQWQASAVSAATWGCVAYSGIGITVIGVFLMNYGAARLPMATSATFSAFMPASSCVLAVLMLGERMQPAQLAGLVLILAGALLTVRRGGDEPAAPARAAHDSGQAQGARAMPAPLIQRNAANGASRNMPTSPDLPQMGARHGHGSYGDSSHVP
jgi:drug/metabolite transporter (DMT)-like permease